jgi:phosphoglycerate dehydrogenase-like enzyme
MRARSGDLPPTAFDDLRHCPRSLTKVGGPALDLLTRQGFELVFSTLGKIPQESELIRLMLGFVGYLAGVEPITAAVLESAADLKVISRNGTGINAIVSPRLRPRCCQMTG